jgi:glycosyltransferase involved in cell wall biosynthesis
MGHEVQTLMHRYAGNLRGVEFVGFVSNIEDYYRQASVLVFPTLAEGLAKVVLEAMASGRPVITTPVLKPVVREGLDGFYVPLRDVAALKERMLYFHQHRDELGRMGKNAAEQAQRFTWERFSRQIADIVATVAAG